jgi:hypothetical protein
MKETQPHIAPTRVSPREGNAVHGGVLREEVADLRAAARGERQQAGREARCVEALQHVDARHGALVGSEVKDSFR